MSKYESNSRKSKEKNEEEERKAPAVKGKVHASKPKEETPASGVLSDLGMIASTMWSDVVVPGILNLSSDLWHSMGDSVFESVTGHTRPSRGHSRYYDGGGRKSYDKYYTRSRKSRRYYDDDDDRPRKKSYGRYSIYEIGFEDLEDAREVRRSLIEQIDEYDFASVKDYYDFSNFDDYEYSDYPNDWGWDDLDPHLRIEQNRRGEYVLRLPRPIPLD